MSATEVVDSLRVDAGRKIGDKGKLGQYFTPAPVARLMASMFACRSKHVRILDAGAGVGSLFSALVCELCQRKARPDSITVTCFEVDDSLQDYLNDTVELCRKQCQEVGVEFQANVHLIDFLEFAADAGSLFSQSDDRFDRAILNPPYFKINTASKERSLIRRIGIETSNIYAGFLAGAIRLLDENGELVAITPRSFCNGPYFKPFRKFFFRNMTLKRLHMFSSRSKAFHGDQVLQENVIFHARNSDKKPKMVKITSNAGPDDEFIESRNVPYDNVVRPDDPDAVIHIAVDEAAGRVASAYAEFTSSLSDLGVNVSTGRVVDFRCKEALRMNAETGTVPLIYPTHFENGFIAWPKPGSKKPNALISSKETASLLVPNEGYVIVKRFSAKEERRRVSAAIYDPTRMPCDAVGFENHLNYFHRNGRGLEPELVKGLAAFLNSTILDVYFRQFSGHTQVNATDLRAMRYPSRETLLRIGETISESPTQDEIDAAVHDFMSVEEDPLNVTKRIDEAITILKSLGLPKAQINERSALCLLTLLDLKPVSAWSDAGSPMYGITQMMDYFAEHFGKRYKPNTRESVRRQSIHQFLDAGLILLNPDDPKRAINSGKTVYQICPDALELLRTYGSKDWDKNLRAYLSSVETLKKRYAKERDMKRIPIVLAEGQSFTLSPGGQNVLVKEIIEEFCPRFTPGALMVYVGDTDEKFAYLDLDLLKSLGVTFDSHGKMPDVIVYHKKKNWLILIEAVTSHGPVDAKRHGELSKMFAKSSAGLVYVTTFLDRKTMGQYLGDIAWETEVWVAEAPTHMIHFNGERFLGPY